MQDTDQSRDAGTVQTPECAVLEQLLNRRYSCRGFLPQPVPPAVIERILALAQRTASWCNAQPWQLVITRGTATERFRAAMLEEMSRPAEAASDFAWPAEYQGDYLARRRECGLGLYEAVGVARGDRAGSARQTMENFRLFGAPHVAIVSTHRPLGVYGAIDCGAYVQNFMLAANSLGVASIAQAALASRPAFLRRHFGLADDRLVVCGLSFGYEDPAHPANGFRTSRADWRGEVTFIER
jgi:nitroreductase